MENQVEVKSKTTEDIPRREATEPEFLENTSLPRSKQKQNTDNRYLIYPELGPQK